MSPAVSIHPPLLLPLLLPVHMLRGFLLQSRNIRLRVVYLPSVRLDLIPPPTRQHDALNRTEKDRSTSNIPRPRYSTPTPPSTAPSPPSACSADPACGGRFPLGARRLLLPSPDQHLPQMKNSHRYISVGAGWEIHTPMGIILAQYRPQPGRVETPGAGEGDGVGARERAREGAGEE